MAGKITIKWSHDLSDELICEMQRAAISEHYSNWLKFTQNLTLYRMNREMIVALAKVTGDTPFYFVARSDSGRLLAFSWCMIHSKLRYVEIIDTLVLRAYARRGLGTILVNAIRATSANFIRDKYECNRWPLTGEVLRTDPPYVLEFWRHCGLHVHPDPKAHADYHQCAELICNTCAKETTEGHRCGRCHFRAYCSKKCVRHAASNCPGNCTTEVAVGQLVSDPVTGRQAYIAGDIPPGISADELRRLVNGGDSPHATAFTPK